MRLSPRIRNFVQWIGGGTAILAGIIYVVSQFSSLNYGQAYLEKTVMQRTDLIEKEVSEKTAPITKIDKNIDRIGQKLNDEIIPALNESVGKERIKTINLLSQLMKQQDELQLSFEKLLEDTDHIYAQVRHLDSLQFTIQSFSERINDISQRSDELEAVIRKFEIAQGNNDTTRTMPKNNLETELPCPDWFVHLPEDPDYLFSATTATSNDLQIAINKAKQDARIDIGLQLETKLQGLANEFKAEIGEADDSQIEAAFAKVSKTITSTTLYGWRTVHQVAKKEGSLWRACVLVEYPIGSANAQFLRSLKDRDSLRQKVLATEAFKELEAEVQKYEKEKEKKAQTNPPKQ